VTHSLAKETGVAIDAAREAARIILSVYQSDFGVERKSRDEPVTEADRRANTLLVERLAAAFPEDGIVAEESVPTEQLLAEQVRRDRVWFVDPLDGTKEFIARNGEFAVMVGLCVKARPVLGVVAQPATGEIAIGVVGEGAWLVDSDGARTALRVSEQTCLGACTVLISRSHVSPTHQRIVDALQPAMRVPCGSVGVKISRIAQRQADVYINPPQPHGSKLWDGCAPEAILVAAGGRVTGFSGELIRYDTTHLDLSDGFLASNGPLHDEVLAIASGVLGAPQR